MTNDNESQNREATQNIEVRIHASLDQTISDAIG